MYNWQYCTMGGTWLKMTASGWGVELSGHKSGMEFLARMDNQQLPNMNCIPWNQLPSLRQHVPRLQIWARCLITVHVIFENYEHRYSATFCRVTKLPVTTSDSSTRCSVPVQHLCPPPRLQPLLELIFLDDCYLSSEDRHSTTTAEGWGGVTSVGW